MEFIGVWAPMDSGVSGSFVFGNRVRGRLSYLIIGWSSLVYGRQSDSGLRNFVVLTIRCDALCLECG